MLGRSLRLESEILGGKDRKVRENKEGATSVAHMGEKKKNKKLGQCKTVREEKVGGNSESCFRRKINKTQ